ncbi:MAG: TetR/AcrR family transcriptional regulator [Candidatus Binatia bacterium]|nr:TetR/AcrR family transcriptional regulator [Candidatus Binatia bacterium]
MSNGAVGACTVVRGRRTQAERSAESRSKILEAAVACISELGPSETTTHRIARRAGLTWGAIQHHFGEKNVILVTVVENSLDGIVAELQEISQVRGTIAERVHALVAGLWPHYSGPLYRAGVEILLSARGDEILKPRADEVRRRAISAVGRAWATLFADFDIPAERHAIAQRVALAMLSGFALEVTMRDEEADFTGELAALEGTLERILREGEG